MPVAAQIERKYVGAGVETARLGGVEGVGPTLNPSPPRKRGVVQQQVHTPSLPRGPGSRHPLERPPFPLSLVANCVLAAQLRHRRVATLVEWANRSCAAPRNLRPAAAPSYTGEQLCRKRWCRILYTCIYIYYIILCSSSIPHCRFPVPVPPMPVHGRDARVAGWLHTPARNCSGVMVHCSC